MAVIAKANRPFTCPEWHRYRCASIDVRDVVVEIDDPARRETRAWLKPIPGDERDFSPLGLSTPTARGQTGGAVDLMPVPNRPPGLTAPPDGAVAAHAGVRRADAGAREVGEVDAVTQAARHKLAGS